MLVTQSNRIARYTLHHVYNTVFALHQIFHQIRKLKETGRSKTELKSMSQKMFAGKKDTRFLVPGPHRFLSFLFLSSVAFRS